MGLLLYLVGAFIIYLGFAAVITVLRRRIDLRYIIAEKTTVRVTNSLGQSKEFRFSRDPSLAEINAALTKLESLKTR